MNPKNERSSSWRSTRALSPATRCAILHRDNFTCVYCPTKLPIKGAQLDHIKARKDGGNNKPTNLVACCGKCNNARQHNQLSPLVEFDAFARALLLPIDRVKGRELAREHYPSRMNRKTST